MFFFFFSSRRRHTRLQGDWSSDVCSSDLPGPIGAVITPQLIGISKSKQLPYASSLCGACREVCPVKIDIPELLLHLREIGRASCRERVEMWVVAGAVKEEGDVLWEKVTGA